MRGFLRKSTSQTTFSDRPPLPTRCGVPRPGSPRVSKSPNSSASCHTLPIKVSFAETCCKVIARTRTARDRHSTSYPVRINLSLRLFYVNLMSWKRVNPWCQPMVRRSNNWRTAKQNGTRLLSHGFFGGLLSLNCSCNNDLWIISAFMNYMSTALTIRIFNIKFVLVIVADGVTNILDFMDGIRCA